MTRQKRKCVKVIRKESKHFENLDDEAKRKLFKAAKKRIKTSRKNLVVEAKEKLWSEKKKQAIQENLGDEAKDKL